jgi:uncharacterized protein (DUF362 family)
MSRAPSARRHAGGSKSKLRRRGRSRRAAHKPSFEMLEQRLLLSADTLGWELTGGAALLEPQDDPGATQALPEPTDGIDGTSASLAETTTSGASLSQLTNDPIGVAQGIYPGRVAWAHDPAATSWDGSSDHYWNDTYTDQSVVSSMLSNVLQWLTGQAGGSAAWDQLFRHFNLNHGGGDVGYASGEKIAVKVNLNTGRSSDGPSNEVDTSPQVMYAVVDQLVNQAGVPEADITLYDASRYFEDKFYTRINTDFPGVNFVDSVGGTGQRNQADPDESAVVHYSNVSGCDTLLPTCVTGAKYVINLSQLKKHDWAGITLSGKNHFGSIYRTDTQEWKPNALHDYVKKENAMGTYNALVDIMGHEHVGGKTMLYLMDALYPAMSQQSYQPDRWQMAPFTNDWMSSLMASQDPVALDSVCVDFLKAELVAREWDPLAPNTDNYLHEAATADQTKSWGNYDPEDDGTPLASLGTHEHWNNATDRQYTRNLGTGDGIELIDSDPGTNQIPTVSITQPTEGQNFAENSDIQIDATASDTDGSVTSVAFYEGANLLGTDTDGADGWGFLWTDVAGGQYALSAKATDNDGGVGWSEDVNITVGNILPTVTITAPNDGAVYMEPADIAITADASDTDGTVTSVAFYQGGTLLHTDTDDSDGWSYTWTGVAAGDYTLTAEATDNDGGTGTSDPVAVHVGAYRAPDAPATLAPGVEYEYYEGTWDALPDFDSLTPVATGYAANFDISLRQQDDDFAFRFTGYVEVPDTGTYTFYTTSDDGSQLFIGDTMVVDNDGLHAPRERSGDTDLQAGKHSVTVTMFEKGGGEVLEVRYAGPGLSKTVIPDSALYRYNAPPTATVTSPPDGTIIPLGDALTMTADASDTDGSIARVEFWELTYNWKLGEDDTAPYEYQGDPTTTPGTYQAIARAVDNHGADGDSAPITFHVAVYGDADCDGYIDQTDFGIVSDNWDPAGTNPGNDWSNGDFDGDGAVGNTDFAFVLANWSEAPAGASTTETSQATSDPASLPQTDAEEGGVVDRQSTAQAAATADGTSQNATEGLNSPIGTPQGIHPGRVAWAHDPAATDWDGSTGYWWDGHTDQSVVDTMMSSAMQWMTGESTDANAWDALFRHFNENHGKGDVGYASGEKIAIKANLNTQRSHADEDNDADLTPETVYALLDHLVNKAGVAQSDITIYDAGRYIADKIYNHVSGDFPNVIYAETNWYSGGGGGDGRATVTESTAPEAEIVYSGGDAAGETDTLPTCVVEAEYLINLALLKKHEMAGVTGIGKNHFGSLFGRSPAHLHNDLPSLQGGMGNYRPMVDLMAHEQIGGKTILYMLDGLWGGWNSGGSASTPKKWQMEPFNNDWPSSLFLSQDPVAIDSVELDFLLAEDSGIQDYADDYLHEAAQADSPASGTHYDPEDDGTPVSESLGVHEHWNNVTDKEYTGGGTGIELYDGTGNAAPTVSITQPVEGDTVAVGGDVVISADASDSDGSVVSVAFYEGGSLLHTDSDGADGWGYTWSSPAVGNYSLTAEAVDDGGASGWSDPVTVHVATPGDANWDEYIDETDFGIVSDNWDPAGVNTNGWGDGDFDDDGAVGNTDFAFVLANWTGGPTSTDSGTTTEATATRASEPAATPDEDLQQQATAPAQDDTLAAAWADALSAPREAPAVPADVGAATDVLAMAGEPDVPAAELPPQASDRAREVLDRRGTGQDVGPAGGRARQGDAGRERPDEPAEPGDVVPFIDTDV